MNFGNLPIANALVEASNLDSPDPTYPLNIVLCEDCSLVQLNDQLPASAHFHADYVYFSSHSASWLDHCEKYANEAIDRWALGAGDQVVEIASNDGYLLQFFQNKSIDVLGVEPSENVALAAIEKGISTEIEFFGSEIAQGLVDRDIRPRLIVANNVLAHVPDLNDFVAGMSILLTDDAVLTAEVHYFRDLFEKNQFDAFYHEHYYYYTIRAAVALFERHGMRLFDVERLDTHGGSLRFYACRADSNLKTEDRVQRLLSEEDEFLETLVAGLDDFRARIATLCENMRNFLKDAVASGQVVVGYGAPAKATTILNFASVSTDLLAYTVDRNPTKQGRYLPGVRIPVLAPEVLAKNEADTLAILVWNLRDEIVAVCLDEYDWKGDFVVFVPRLEHIKSGAK